ncbi:hypothetical protein AMAG_16302 [Allomyces macrogynus ATCC 38327]|uniref:NUDE domain-containing protein n=1 Tax=Allomyces macrogynus (strain ATCC 38327) TaxID=578462 RepID=A0A0L0TAN4_ALLM3|nr:hypothetical protein AMAG_16302 [Allomyces macrogynus ATCC 38327]|eukprot:KNE71873.1 hypothetical protein AMAG_16302 [Allomyces macrogynus ATCC 38327]
MTPSQTSTDAAMNAARDLASALAARDTELAEFRSESADYERELEAEIDLLTHDVDTERTLGARLAAELADVQEASRTTARDAADSIDRLQTQLASARAQVEVARKVRCEKEDEVEALEMRTRELDASLSTLSSQYTRAAARRTALDTQLATVRAAQAAEHARLTAAIAAAKAQLAAMPVRIPSPPPTSTAEIPPPALPPRRSSVTRDTTTTCPPALPPRRRTSHPVPTNAMVVDDPAPAAIRPVKKLVRTSSATEAAAKHVARWVRGIRTYLAATAAAAVRATSSSSSAAITAKEGNGRVRGPATATLAGSWRQMVRIV